MLEETVVLFYWSMRKLWNENTDIVLASVLPKILASSEYLMLWVTMQPGYWWSQKDVLFRKCLPAME